MKSHQKDDDKVTSERIKELALSDGLTSIILLVHELQDLKTALGYELDLAQRRRHEMAKDHVDLINEMWATLKKIRAQFRIEAQLLGLIGPKNAGEEGWEKNNSNHCRTLDGLSKNTH